MMNPKDLPEPLRISSESPITKKAADKKCRFIAIDIQPNERVRIVRQCLIKKVNVPRQESWFLQPQQQRNYFFVSKPLRTEIQ